jgi:RNA polymerase sigma-70 factor (ECF subfamily)
MRVEPVVEADEHQRLVRIVAVACGSHSDAEDAVQDAYAAALRMPERPENLSAWVVTVASRRAIGGWRRRQSERRSWDRLAATHDPGRDVDQLIDLRVALASLSPRQLEVVQLYYFLGLAVAETAGQLGISEGTVKKALSRARETLRRALEITP